MAIFVTIVRHLAHRKIIGGQKILQMLQNMEMMLNIKECWGANFAMNKMDCLHCGKYMCLESCIEAAYYKTKCSNKFCCKGLAHTLSMKYCKECDKPSWPNCQTCSRCSFKLKICGHCGVDKHD